MNVLSIATRHRILMHLLFTGTLILFMCIFPLKAEGAADAEGLFSQGNHAYSQGRYNEALSYYKEVMEKEGFSASLLYNMANAYYQKKDMGQAILNYERALYLDPGNPDIQANLRLAKKELRLDPEPVPVWKGFFNTLKLDQWTWMASIGIVIFCLLFFFRGLAPKILSLKLLRGVAG